MENFVFTYDQQISNQSQPEQGNEIPVRIKYFLKHCYENKGLFDMFSSTLMVDGFEGDAVSERFRKDEVLIDEILHDFREWLDIDYASKENEALLKIIFAYQKAAFRAGFESAKELLTK